MSSVVDAAAVACGAVAVAAGAWRNRGAAVALLAVIGIRGVGRRQ